MKRVKHKEAHTSPTKIGMGDYYGTAIKNPIGKLRSDPIGVINIKSKALKKPPKNLA